MDDTHVVAVDLRRVLGLQEANRPLDGVHGQIAVVVLAGVVQLVPAVHLALAKLNHRAGVDDLPGDGVQSPARLAGDQLGGLDQIVVDGSHHQHVRQSDISAVLLHLRGDGLHGEGLAVRGHTFYQRSGLLRQGVVLAELDDLAAVLGNRVLLAELIVDQLGLRQVDQVVGVEDLHLRRHAVAGGEVRIELPVKQRKHDGQQDVISDGFHG